MVNILLNTHSQFPPERPNGVPTWKLQSKNFHLKNWLPYRFTSVLKVGIWDNDQLCQKNWYCCFSKSKFEPISFQNNLLLFIHQRPARLSSLCKMVFSKKISARSFEEKHFWRSSAKLRLRMINHETQAIFLSKAIGWNRSSNVSIESIQLAEHLSVTKSAITVLPLEPSMMS